MLDRAGETEIDLVGDFVVVWIDDMAGVVPAVAIDVDDKDEEVDDDEEQDDDDDEEEDKDDADILVVLGAVTAATADKWLVIPPIRPVRVVASNSRLIPTPPPNDAVMAASHGKTVPNIAGVSALLLLLLLSVSSTPSAISDSHPDISERFRFLVVSRRINYMEVTNFTICL